MPIVFTGNLCFFRKNSAKPENRPGGLQDKGKGGVCGLRSRYVPAEKSIAGATMESCFHQCHAITT